VLCPVLATAAEETYGLFADNTEYSNAKDDDCFVQLSSFIAASSLLKSTAATEYGNYFFYSNTLGC